MATSVKLDGNIKNRIEQLADKQQHSAHWIMREAIGEYFGRQEAPEKFKQKALTSWTSYQQTGHHLTGGEVREWLQTWGTDAEKEIPKCHE